MARPKRSYLNKTVSFQWRDSLQGDINEDISSYSDDILWTAAGEVVKESDLCITISLGRQVNNVYMVHSPLSIPWTQIVTPIKVLS